MTGFFPIFMNLTDKCTIVVGGGSIAARRTSVLCPFGSHIVVIAPTVCQEIWELEHRGDLHIIPEEYHFKYIEKMASETVFIIAATNNRAVNHRIGEDGKKLGILVNIADCKEESDFYFPGIAYKENIVVGVTAGGTDHRSAKKITKKLQQWLLEGEESGDQT